MQLEMFQFAKKGAHKQSYLSSSPDTPCPHVSTQSPESGRARGQLGKETGQIHSGEKVEKKTYKRRVGVMSGRS